MEEFAMKYYYSFARRLAALTLFLLVPISGGALVYGQGFQGGPGQRLQLAGLELGSSLPDDLAVFDVGQNKVKLNSLLEGHYTVLVSGCLTCPAFLRSYSGVEAVHRDYASQDVQFYYLYKALAHPENNGYVQVFTIGERFAHIEDAKMRLGTQIPWLADPISNEVTNTFGTTPNSEFIFDPDGKIVHMQVWSSGRQLRTALEDLFGPVGDPTKISDLQLPEVIPLNSPTRGVVESINFSETLIPILIDPTIDGTTYYVKLRAEVTDALLRTGSGQMYLGFHLDPIHRVHWNNLVDPISYDLTMPTGTTVTPSSGSAPKVEQVSDNDPREFLVDVTDWRSDDSITLSVNYYACDEDDRWCRAVSQNYTIQLERDLFGGGVIGRSFRGGGRGNRSGDDAGLAWQQMMRFDTSGDGKISMEEAPDPLKRRFGDMDINNDRFIDEQEMKQMIGRMRGGRRRGR
ncbi:MAG: hypothetical protein E2O85_02155 [Bacteroidetes bacterium]|nr:MAG: hypothetical protein E2O85_02155 [Bacteroidota bacterium]